jgi:hypothetical protein
MSEAQLNGLVLQARDHLQPGGTLLARTASSALASELRQVSVDHTTVNKSHW